MMRQRPAKLALAAILAAGGSGLAWADGGHDAALIKALADARVSLQQGLVAGQSQGQPVSGKFEIEDGRLRLSVDTEKDGNYYEVIVDYSTGKVTKVMRITEGDHLTEAKSQSAAMGRAKTALREIVDRATGLVSGARAVSVIPDLKSGRPLSAIVLLRAGQLQTIMQQLD